MVVGWFRVIPPDEELVSTAERITDIGRRLLSIGFHPEKLMSVLGYLFRKCTERRLGNCDRLTRLEEQMLGDEVRGLRKFAVEKPRTVSDPNDERVVEEVRRLEPYFLLTLGGAIYQLPLLRTASGLALNQHDGWCPNYRGSNTVDWALYHRDVKRVGTTIHLLAPGMDSGPVVRRSRVCLVPNDTKESCFVRVVALGTELMCEVVADVLKKSAINVYDQPEVEGATFCFRDLTQGAAAAIDRDSRSGWLAEELARLQSF